jgi:hypothetical protein
VRVAAIASALGQSESVYGYSTTDYVLRSVSSLFFPLLVLTGVALLVLIAHQRVQGSLRDGEWAGAPMTARLLMWIGIGLLLYGALYAWRLFELQNALIDITGPLALGLGALMLAYGGWLREQVRPEPTRRLPIWQRAFAAGMLMAIAALSLFWAVGNYATVRGIQDARLIEAGYQQFPSVEVYAAKDLGLTPDASVVHLAGVDSQYTYRYGCMYLLDHVAGVWYLLPDDWIDTGRLIMLRDDAALRFELVYPDDAVACPTVQ